MGRRSRTRKAAGTPPATPGGVGDSSGGGLLHRLNPIKSPPGRTRVRIAAAAFAVGAVALAAVGWVTRRGAWFNPAISLAILAAVWGLYSLVIREDDRSS